ncbi:MAG: hypothetical protein ACRDGI_02575 [Candidatus Limnocylindrales bacterium]
MTLERQVASIEAALTPTELVVRWLDAAHAAGGLEAWVRGQLADDAAPAPMDFLARAASEGVRVALKGKPREQIAKAIDVALFQTIVRFQLVLRVNVLSHELIERQTMLDMVFAGQIALLANVRRSGPPDPADNERLAARIDHILTRVVELRAFGQARTEVEARYLAGHPALFADDTAAWAERLESTTELGYLALRLGELDGLPDSRPAPDPEPSSERVAALVADFVEPAKAVTFGLMDEGRRAYRVGTNWLRSELQHSSDGKRAAQ